MNAIPHRLLRVVAAMCLGASVVSQSPALAQDAKALLEEARVSAAAGRYIDALAAFAGAIAASPADPGAYARRAQLFQSLNHPDLASRDYRAAVRLKPDDAVLQGNLCWTLAQANHDLDGALAACNAAVKLDAGSYDALGKRGYVQLRRGAWAEAERDYAAALELNMASPNEMFGHGLATIHLGRSKDGRDEIASATLDSPGLVNEWAALGFGARGEIRPGLPLTTAGEPVISIKWMKIFANKGGESYIGSLAGCGHMIPPPAAADLGAALFDHRDLVWSGECRFGLYHGEGRLTKPGEEDSPPVRYAYGRVISPDAAGATLERKVTLAYQVVEEAARP